MNNRDVNEVAAILAQAKNGDDEAFAKLIEVRRVSLFRHCYRMLGSGPEAEDAVQETLIRAWQRLAKFEGTGSFQGWVFRIATNLCIDRLRGRPRKVHPVSFGPAAAPGTLLSVNEVNDNWVEPVADQKIGMGKNPEDSMLQRERISLAFVAALHRLSARQRAALLLHDVLDFSHKEVAEVLDTSTSAVNNLLYRARKTVHASPIFEPADPNDPTIQSLLKRYMRAWELADISEFIATVRDDVQFSMPPLTIWYQGSEAVASFIEATIFSLVRPHGGVPMIPGQANGQPAIATYEPGPDNKLVVGGLQVLDVDAHSKTICAVTSFRDPGLAIRCGFPRELIHDCRRHQRLD